MKPRHIRPIVSSSQPVAHSAPARLRRHLPGAQRPNVAPRTLTRAYSASLAPARPVAQLADSMNLPSFTSGGHGNPLTAPSNPRERYRALTAAGTLKGDEHQTRIVEKLQRLYSQVAEYVPPPIPSETSTTTSLFSRLFGTPTPQSSTPVPTPTPQGLYLYGDVGTGKTMLMDLFFNSLPPAIKRKRRVHFHAFMVDVHKRVHAAKLALGLEGGDPIAPVAKDLAKEAYILCFDEFQVTDVADAMILRRLFEALLDYGVVCVITSNRHPDNLYKNGIQRESFVPCIELLKSRLDITDLDSGTDYRRIPRALSHVYHSPLDHATRTEMRKLFDSLTSGKDVVQGRKLYAWGREIHVPESTDDIALFEFADLCGNRRPMSAADYIEVTKAFGTIFLTEVPKLDLGTKDLARRFITFVDACYESKTKLFVSSELPIYQIFSDNSQKDTSVTDHMRAVMDDLGLSADVVGTSSMFTGDEEIFAFARCCSRLVEMGSKEWAESAGVR